MLRKIVVGPYQANCYILGSKNSMKGLVIDPGDEVFRIVNTITGLSRSWTREQYKGGTADKSIFPGERNVF